MPAQARGPPVFLERWAFGAFGGEKSFRVAWNGGRDDWTELLKD